MPRLISDPAFEDVLEKRYFQFFRQKSVASSNHLVETRFWDRLVLQTCHHEPAIKHAVLALSSLHQLGQLPRGSDAARQHEAYAERQHQKALTAAQRMISASQEHDFDKVLTACVIFIIFESVRGDYKAAAVHMASGRAILAQYATKLKRRSRRKDLIEIEHALGRLDLAAVVFQDESSPYSSTVADFHGTDPEVVPYAFNDIGEAQTCLIDLCRWLLLAEDRCYEAGKVKDIPESVKYQAEKTRCTAQLQRWERFFEDVLDRADDVSQLVILNLKTWYAFAMLLSKAPSYGPETRFDAFMSDFEKIVCCAERMATSQSLRESNTFSYEIGYLGPVYFAATRCRDPSLRRRGIAILQEYPRQEGVLESVAAASLARAWMEAEEAGYDVCSASDVPEEWRLVTTDAQVDVQKGQALLTLNPSLSGSNKRKVLVTFEAK